MPELCSQPLAKPEQPSPTSHRKWSVNTQYLLLSLFALLAAYQVNVMQNMIGKMSVLEEKLSNLDGFIKNIDKPTTKKSEEYDYKHAPHSEYFKNIPTLSNDSRIPLDVSRTYSYDDFEAIFGVQPLHVVEVEEEVSKVLEGHDPKLDKYYGSHKDEIEERLEDFIKYIEYGSHEAEDRERFEIKWASPKTGFGMFAKKDIKKGDIVGIYGGVITSDVDNTDYMWDYLTYHVGEKKVAYGLDARLKGNYLRFSNHIGDDANTLPYFIPYKNLWYVFYVCEKDIKAGEEVTTDYGDDYFATRV